MSWESIKYVGGWFSLAAFIIAAILSYLRYRTKQQSEMLKSTPDKDKSRVVDKILGRFDVKTEKLTIDQQYNLALTQIQNSQRRYQGWLLLAGVATILLCALWGASMVMDKGEYRPPILSVEQQNQLESHLENAKFARDNQRYTEALGYYRKAAEMDKDNPEIAKEIELLNEKTGGSQ